jgi:hypothetical protein
LTSAPSVPAPITSHSARVRTASRNVQPNSGAGVRSVPAAPTGGGAAAPSGSNPTSSGRRRSTSAAGATNSTSIAAPKLANTVRQPYASMMSCPTAARTAPPSGVAMAIRPIARPRSRRNQLAAVVIGTTPASAAVEVARATTWTT